MKKYMSMLIGLCLILVCLTLLTTDAQAVTVVSSGKCGYALTWTLDTNGVLVISGTGSMNNWYWSNRAPWYSTRSSVKAVVIDRGVTSIGDSAFEECESLFSVVIPDTVTKIGESAFEKCISLTSVTIPDSVTGIERYAFYKCEGLTSVTLSNSVTSIENTTFTYCKSLTSVTIPDSVTAIGNSAFSSCSSLRSVTIGKGVTDIAYNAFWYCDSLTDFTVSEDNTVYSHDANGLLFNKDKTKLLCVPQGKTGSFTIPSEVTSVGEYAFYYCSGLTSVIIPDGITHIEKYTFYNCKRLESITIPQSVTGIGNQAFFGCEALTSITIPDSVTSLGSYAFYGCKSLESITIPQSITTIESYSFFNCSRLVDVTIPDSVTDIGSYAFHGCSSLKSITIPQGVTTIEPYLFYDCSSLKSVTIPNSVTSIGNHAFYYCRDLTSITIPEGVTEIGDAAFSGCRGLTAITIPDSVTRIESYAFYYCRDTLCITIGKGVERIGDCAFWRCDNLATVVFTGAAPDIGENAFGNNDLESVCATAYYPCGDATWTESKHQNYGGVLAWKKYHNCEVYTVVEAATCTGDALVSGMCKDCQQNVISFRPYTATGHSYEEGIVDPTCTQDGAIMYTCACGHSYIGTSIPATGHSYQEVITDRTCTKDGYIKHICTTCGYSYQGASVAATGHSFGKNNICTACGAAGEMRIKLYDSGSDGWNDNALQIFENDILLTTATFSGGSSHQIDVTYYSDRVYTFYWVKGSVSYECSFDITLGSQKLFSAAPSDCMAFIDGQSVYQKGICKHSYQASVTYPTLTVNGYTKFTCKDCGYYYVKNYTFPDVPSTLWSYNAIEFAVAKGYFSGYQSGNFGPTDSITRQDFVVVLARIAKVDLTKYNGRTGFPDVQAGSYYEAAVKWASSTGIVAGYNSGKFGVGDNITREQLVTILYRYAQKMGYDTTVSETAASRLYRFGDAGKVTSYAKAAVIWALDNGVISGMTDTTVAPQNTASRGQVATILMNICKKNIMPI